MAKLFIFFIIAITSYEALGKSVRHKRQSDGFTFDDGMSNDTWQRRRQQWNSWQQPRITTTTTTTTTTTRPASSNEQTTQSAEIQRCVRGCGVTSEYNPVCGSNNNTYDNPSRLYCAQACGVDVTHRRYGKCT